MDLDPPILKISIGKNTAADILSGILQQDALSNAARKNTHSHDGSRAYMEGGPRRRKINSMDEDGTAKYSIPRAIRAQ
jgi:hypothetical protein